MGLATAIRVFEYLPELDAFVVTEPYRRIADSLGLSEWHPAVWIGRLFIMDNDLGEHWFDNWDERERLAARAAEVGIEVDQLLVVSPTVSPTGVTDPATSRNSASGSGRTFSSLSNSVRTCCSTKPGG